MSERQTGIDAYEKIKRDGSLTRAQLEVYKCLHEAVPDGMTRNEIDARLSPGKPNAMYSRRLSEMERMGVVRRMAGSRICSVSNHRCEAWTVTGKLPVKGEPPRAWPPCPPPPTPPNWRRR